MDSSDIFDVTQFAALSDFIGARIDGVVESFVQNASVSVDAIEEGFDAGDAKRIASVAHSMKSSCGNFGLSALYEALDTLEERAQAVEDGGRCEDLAPLVEPLRALYETSLAALQDEVNRRARS